jgi:hypothetical protein
MPEPYWPKRKGSYTLADSARNGAYLRAECRYCKTVHFYLPADMKEVCGDVQVDDVKFRCETCGDRDIRPSEYHPPIAELQTMTIRRLEKIYFQRRVVWRDEPAWKGK